MDDDTRPADTDLVRATWDEARELIRRLEGSSVTRLAIAAGDTRIEVERGLAAPAAAPPASTPAAVAADAGAPAPAETDGRHAILAPLVGTFYRSSQPGAKPFVEEGDVVDAGQTVAIVEAMKLMNHVAADIAGKVAEIAVADGDWVEFEQVLIYLEPVEE